MVGMDGIRCWSVVATPRPQKCFVTKTAPINSDEMFFQLESLGTMIEPKCGSCACSKCPVPGSKYCFSQQKELDRIMNNLNYDEALGLWSTPLPWKFPRSDLPRNEKIALQSLHALERRLIKDSELAKDFSDQIHEMVKRGAASVLSKAGPFSSVPRVRRCDSLADTRPTVVAVKAW